MPTREIRILLCEYSAIHHEGLITGFRAALKSAGYRASIEASASIDNALDLLATGEFQILITDLSFNRNMAVGLDFVKLVKTKYPHLYVIACSSGAPSVDMVRNKRPSFDLYVPKRVILNAEQREIEEIGGEIHGALGRLIGFKLNVRGRSLASLRVSGEPIEEWELTTLISQVLSDLNATDEPFRPVEVTFTPVKGGYSGSLVGKLSLGGSIAPLKYVKTILKISFAKWAKDEVKNFQRYAKWMLPFNRRVELVGEGRTGRFGAVAYAFVFGGEEHFFNLTSIVQKKDAAEVISFINVVFDHELLNFYNDTRIDSGVNIGQHYRSRYFPDDRMEETTRVFQEIIQRHFAAKEEASGWRIGDQLYPEPFRVIFSGIPKKFSLSICHGDLNSDNIICASGNRIAYIDFQDTGPGHLLQDFAALESSIRLNWGADEDKKGKKNLATLLRREWGIASNSRAAASSSHYDRLCVALRALARNKFPGIEPWEYPYAIGALSLKLMRVRGFNEAQLCRLAACALVATRQFQTIKENNNP